MAKQKRASFSRWDVAVEIPGDCRMRWQSRTDVSHTAESVADALEKLVAEIRAALRESRPDRA